MSILPHNGGNDGRVNNPRPASRPRAGLVRNMLALGAAFGGGWIAANLMPSGYYPASPNQFKSNNLTVAIKSNALPAHIAWNLKNPLADILKKYTGGARIDAILKLVDETPVPGLGHLLDLAAICPEKDVCKLVQDLVYAKWVAVDPHGALAYATVVATQTGKPDALNSLFATWAGLNPQAAFAAAQNLSRPSFRNAETLLVLANWVQNGEPTAALIVLRKLGNGKIDGPMAQTFFDMWSKIDPNAAWSALNQITSATTRTTAMNLILDNMAGSDPQGAFKLLLSMPVAGITHDTYKTMFAIWAEQNPVTANAALGQLAGPARLEATEAVFTTWGQTDPSAALQATQALAPSIRIRAQTDVLKGLVEQEPQQAADFVATVQTGMAGYGNMLNTLVSGWSDSDPAAALAWINQHETGLAYKASLSTVLGQLSKSDPAAAAMFVSQLPENGNYARDDNLTTTMSNWAYINSDAAIAWAQSNLNGPTQAVALAGVADALTKINPSAAAEILGRLPNSLSRNNVLSTLAAQWVQVDPNAASQWSQNLPADLPDKDRSAINKKIKQANPGD